MKRRSLKKRLYGSGTTALLTIGFSLASIYVSQGQSTNAPAPASESLPPDSISTNGGTATIPPVLADNSFADGLTPDAIIHKAKTAYAALQSYSDSGTTTSQMGSFTSTTNFNIRLQRPNLYRIDWQGSGVASKGVVWSDGTGDFLQYAGLTTQKQQNRQMALASATGISGGAAASLPGTFFNESWGGKLSGGHHRLKDETVSGVDCYVLSNTITHSGNSFSTVLWIGKEDNLIRQIKTVTGGMPSLPPIDDASLKTVLTSQNKPVTPETMDALRKQLTAAQELAKGLLKAGPIESLESHAKIVTTKTFALADFKPDAN